MSFQEVAKGGFGGISMSNTTIFGIQMKVKTIQKRTQNHIDFLIDFEIDF